MKTTKPNAGTARRGNLFALWLAGILALLFWRSFLPGYVHFSNDGPLGQKMVNWAHLPAAFAGQWGDLNDIGGNGGACPLGLNALLHMVLGPVGCAKFLPPLALFILGLGAWTFFRQLGFSTLATTLGALAATLNSTFFANACWGVTSQQIALGMVFFALALVVANTPETPALICWLRYALAGLAVGVNVIEAADIGAIFSLLVSAFVLFLPFASEAGSGLAKLARGIGRIAVIAGFAGFIAAQTVVALVGSQIQGIAGTAQDTETKSQHWDWATQWSYPKMETLGLFVPGVFGYKYDTPKDMMEFLQNSYQGGVYWGAVGRDPAWDRYFAGGEKGPQPQGILRFAGGQNYGGILVVLVALWAIAQSLRRQDSVFSLAQRRLIWLWTAVLVVSLLLAFGRYAPFYQFFYMLPYFSTIRNPAKFILVFSFAIVTLFAYGAQALSRRYLETPATGPAPSLDKFKAWWAKASPFDRSWTWFCLAAFAVSVLAWFIYGAEKPALVGYLQKVGFPDEATAQQMAAFSLGQASWFVLLFAVAIGLCLLVLAGVLAGKRARLGGFLLGAFVVFDLGRADLPYIAHWDYKQKYATNPILNLLRDKPYEHRVAGLPFHAPQQLALFEELYRIEWMQHHFPYYNIQSLDVVQRPRLPADVEAYVRTLAYDGTPDSVYRIARHWQLTNTRYLLGPAGFLDVLNEQLDPAARRFRVAQRFDVVPKPGIERPTRLEDLTAVPDDNGNYALFEFAGALPRAKLYDHWQVNTNDALILEALASTNFDAWQTVLVSTPLTARPAAEAANASPAAVEFKSYAPKDIVFETKAGTASVLLLNDKFDPNWRVFVDGQPAELLRCNFIMRGVLVPAGSHTVEFKFSLPHRPLYVTLAAIGVGICLCGLLLVSTRRQPDATT
ncbi:MAG TPA: hypothetical protein VMB80_12885 [Candidatus Acidoferrum sp.]|nr:hypothetical protein [Candidatus Acidoferrum sp.]